MVENHNPVSGLEVTNARTYRGNFSGGFMAEDSWRGMGAGGDFL
jgi:hypothetical protein